MPHLIGMFGNGNPNIFLTRVDVIEETKINRSSGFGKKRKVHAVAQPRRTEWIWITKPGLYRSHKGAAFLSNTEGVGNSRFDVEPTCALSTCRCTSAPAEYARGERSACLPRFVGNSNAIALSIS